MNKTSPLIFKIADQESEFEQIHRLNYRTFAEEIPQHAVNRERRLRDRFHDENTYMICLRDGALQGMICVRGKRPFSLDEKLTDLDAYLPRGSKPCEIRLLSVEKTHRNGKTLLGLLRLLARHCESRGYDPAIISGTLRQTKLYRHLGFVPFGPVVGAPAARFQPMVLTAEAYQNRTVKLLESLAAGSNLKPLINLLPGPVSVAPEVRRNFIQPPVSHRSEAFIADFQQTRRLLCALVGSKHVELLMGSGTLANDAVAGQISLLPGRGLILSNGEFGDRLIDHANRFGLSFDILRADWGGVFGPDQIRRIIDRSARIEWLWAVHSETSTGILNDIGMLKKISTAKNLRLCLDCISSIGTVAVDLHDVYLASGVSGKGLAAFPGLSMVFYNHPIEPAERAIPRYLDVGFYAARGGVPFTISSNLIYALRASLLRRLGENSADEILGLSRRLRARLRAMGFRIVAPDAHAAPTVITIALPETICSDDLGQYLEATGYSLSYKSEYLLRRNWIQICLMGECTEAKLTPLLESLQELSYSLPR
ncbi:MAG TPA: aminotransferase class V-fold PLP-dependent enzyme, partial [Candidatus Binatia bacterium]